MDKVRYNKIMKSRIMVDTRKKTLLKPLRYHIAGFLNACMKHTHSGGYVTLRG